MKQVQLGTPIASAAPAVLLLLCCPACQPDEVISKQDGDWENPNTWEGGLPEGNDVVVLHTVTITQDGGIKEVASLSVQGAWGRLITVHPDDDITIMAVQGDIEVVGGAVLACRGSDDAQGGEGAEVALMAVGDNLIDEGSQVRAGDGGTAYTVWEHAAPEATGGAGGRGGNLSIQGDFIQIHAATTVSPGNGGPGGAGGDWYMEWWGGTDVPYVHAGSGERGGNALAVAGPGTRGLAGGEAEATGGQGGASGGATFEGALPALRGGAGGPGGSANATGGPGWCAVEHGGCDDPGTNGGPATATGGKGGNGLWAGGTGGAAHATGNFGGKGRDAGNGGKAKAQGGFGGEQTDLLYSTGPAGTGGEARADAGPGGPGSSCCECYPDWQGGNGGIGALAEAQGGYGGTAKHNKGGDGGALWAHGGNGGKHRGAGGIPGLVLPKPGRGEYGPMGRGLDGAMTTSAGAAGEAGGDCQPPP